MSRVSGRTGAIAVRMSGGELRSRRIRAPYGRGIRPTPGRVREALFSILGERIVGARVLDLFAGTGAVGCEALSRGADGAFFVEVDPRIAQQLRQTVTALGLAQRATILCGDAARIASRIDGRFDVVFADPPFAQSAPCDVFDRLHERGCIDDRTLIVYERRSSAPPMQCPQWRTERTVQYGAVALEFARCAATHA